jgi:hypothetical protein
MSGLSVAFKLLSQKDTLVLSFIVLRARSSVG